MRTQVCFPETGDGRQVLGWRDSHWKLLHEIHDLSLARKEPGPSLTYLLQRQQALIQCDGVRPHSMGTTKAKPAMQGG